MQNDKCKSQNETQIPCEGRGQQRSFDLGERLLEFAARIGRLVDALPDSRMGRHIASQLLRSETSPAPNYEEGCSAESRRDFVHKLSICLKELRESRCWLRMVIRTGLLPKGRLSELVDECEQLCRIVGQSIVTAKRNDGRSATALRGPDRLVGQRLAMIEQYYIERTLDLVGGQRDKAAAILGITEEALDRKIQKYQPKRTAKSRGKVDAPAKQSGGESDEVSANR